MKKNFCFLLVPTLMLVMCFSEINAQEWKSHPWFRTDKAAGGANSFIKVVNKTRIKELTIRPLNGVSYQSLLKERSWAVPASSHDGYKINATDQEISFPAQVVYFTYKRNKAGKAEAAKPTEVAHVAFMVTYNDGVQVKERIVSGSLSGAGNLLTNKDDVGHTLTFNLTDEALGLRPLPVIILKTKINYPMFISLGDIKFLLEGGESNFNIEGDLKKVETKVFEAPEPGNYDFDFEIKIPSYGWVQVWNQNGTRKKLRASVNEKGEILTVIPQDLLGIIGSSDNTSLGSRKKKTIFLRTFVSPGLEFFWGSTIDQIGSRIFSDKNERALIASERYSAFSLPAGNVSFMYRPTGTTNVNRFFIAELPISRRQKGKFTIRQGIISSDTN